MCSRIPHRLLIVLTVCLALHNSVAQATTASDSTNEEANAKISFNESIRPLFAKHCVACHGGVKQAAGLSFIYRDIATSETEYGVIAIVPGSPDESYLLDRVTSEDPDYRMPPAGHGPALSPAEVELLRSWIEQGAEWERLWSFTPPRDQEQPTVQQQSWPRRSLDSFVLAELESEGLAPSDEASKATWLRRVSLDLIGLPPSAEEYAEFSGDASDDAYERTVERLLASPRFGERWASMWLDLARYADTQGYEKDPHRNIWPYRDWVIRAFNDDMPYDEFTIKQLAGDLLPGATIGDRVATAFNRNSQTNTEGGTDDEEFRIAALLDRVSTTWQTWQATTFRCVQCHSHPYDPYRHEEYYRFAALLNTTRDADLGEDLPLLAVPNDSADWPAATKLDRAISQLRRSIVQPAQSLAANKRWTPLKPNKADATGQTNLVIRDDDRSDVAEILTEGTITSGGTFTIEFALSDQPAGITALRIDALPRDLPEALKTPEMGFMLTRLEAQVLQLDRDPQQIEFKFAVCDEAEPLFEPIDSVGENNNGWAAYTRLDRPRYAVFVPLQPIEAPADSRLQLKLSFGRTATGDIPLVIHRGRFSVSSDPAWTSLAKSEQLDEQRSELERLQEERNKIACTPIPVMASQEDHMRRQLHRFERGNWLDKADRVEPGVPAIMPPLPDGDDNRLAMAQWIASPENPLTARVMVNRLWQELFGIGIVETAGDFGTSGARPSHPELLDHLAIRFQSKLGWSIKRLLKEIVLSATYRQASRATAEQFERDPRNRLLSRGPRTRLTAEMIRDQALALSGKLTNKMYGPPVMPPQPEGVWRAVYSGAQWKTAEGPDRYRRAVYTYCRRTSGYPAYIAFDMPSREVCVARRIPTNTPLQALATLNDEAFIELANHYGTRMLDKGGDKPAEQIASGYHWATGREISQIKLDRLLALYEQATTAFDMDQQAAQQLANSRETYALAIVGNALLNLDEVLTK